MRILQPCLAALLLLQVQPALEPALAVEVESVPALVDAVTAANSGGDSHLRVPVAGVVDGGVAVAGIEWDFDR